MPHRTVSGGNGKDAGLAAVFLRLLDLPDRAVMDVIAVVIGETLAAGSAAVEATGLEIGLDMARYWQADEAFFECVRDREVLTALVADVAGEEVAAANAKEKGATLKQIVRDHLNGNNDWSREFETAAPITDGAPAMSEAASAGPDRDFSDVAGPEAGAALPEPVPTPERNDR